MEFITFHSKFPDIAENETRVAHLDRKTLSIPAGSYAFIDHYCADDSCDCRKVMITVVRAEDPSVCLATIGYGWEKEGFYKKWFGNKKGARELTGSYLEPGGVQSKHARDFLALWEHLLQDENYIDRIKRHYKSMKS